MAEIRQEFNFDDKGGLQMLRTMRDLAVRVEKAYEGMADGSDKFAKETKEDLANARKALDNVVDGLDKKEKATEADAKATTAWKDELKKAAGEVNVLGVNVGQVVDNLKAKKKALIEATKAITGGTKAMKIFKIALASTGIGILLVAIGSLVAYFKSTQEGADRLQRIMKVVGSVFANVRDVASDLGEKIFEAISNPKQAIADFGNLIKDQIINRFLGAIEILQGLGGAIERFVVGDLDGLKVAANNAWDGLQKFITGVDEGIEKAVKGIAGFTKEMIEDGRAIDEITKKQQDLARAIDLVETQREKDQARIEELNGIAQDTLKTDQERAEAAQQAMSINQASQKTLISLKEQLLEQIRAENALSKSMDVDRQREYDLVAEIAQLKSGATTKQTELNNTLNSINQAGNAIREQELAQVQALNDAYFELVGTIEQRLAQQELEKLSGRERLAAERAIALEEIDLLESKAKAAAIASGQEYTLAQQFLQIRGNIIESYKEEARILADQERVVSPLMQEVDELGERGQDSAQRAGEELSASLAEGAKKGLEENKALFDEVRSTIGGWLGLGDQEMAELEQSVSEAFNLVGQLYTDSINRQLDENGRLLDSLQERESIVQGQLDRELQLQEEGRANNVEGKRKELESIRQEEAKAEQKAAELRRKQQSAQLIANTIKQASNLATAVSEIFASNAGIPIVGIIQAGISIAAMFAAFASAKSQAQSAVSQRAYKGGPLDDYLGGKRRSGFVKRGGTSDKPGRGSGYRIMGTDVVVGGDEFMMNEDDSRVHDKFLTAMNRGAFRNVNLNSLVENQAVSLADMTKYNRLTSMRRSRIERSRGTHRDRLVVDAIDRNFRELLRLEKGKVDRMAITDYESGWVEFSGDNRKIIRK